MSQKREKGGSHPPPPTSTDPVSLLQEEKEEEEEEVSFWSVCRDFELHHRPRHTAAAGVSVKKNKKTPPIFRLVKKLSSILSIFLKKKNSKMCTAV